MCGICGVVSARGIDASLVEAMRDVMTTRGPDDAGLYRDPSGKAVLGHRRLSIIDLSGAGRQPLGNEDESIQVVVNGEFYGFAAIRDELVSRGHSMRSKSDSEIAVHLYEEHGAGFVSYLPGMFAVALWDSKSGRLVLARDRVGKKPLYWTNADGRLAFASDLNAVAGMPWVQRRLDRAALNHYFALGYVPGDMSIYEDVHKLPAGFTLTYDTNVGVPELKRYWELPAGQPFTGSDDDAEERLEQLLRTAVRNRLVSDVPVGVFLSGGVDSSLITALAAQESGGTLRSFTIGFEEQSHDERPYASSVAAHVGTAHEEYQVHVGAMDLVDELPTQYGEPFADSSAIPTFHVSRMTRSQVTVALSGDGGDELFGGYNWYSWVLEGMRLRRALGPLAAVAGRLGSALPRGVRGRHYLSRIGLDALGQYIERTFVMSAEERLALLADGTLSGVEVEAPEDWVRVAAVGSTSALDAMTRVDGRRYLVDDVLTKVDRASMAVSLEVRSPILDQQVVEFAYALPDHMKIRDGERKWLLKRLARRLLPETHDLERKQGFSVPMRAWMDGSLGDATSSAVRDSSVCAEYLRPGEVERLLAEHRRGWRDNSTRLWSILVFARWLEARP